MVVTKSMFHEAPLAFIGIAPPPFDRKEAASLSSIGDNKAIDAAEREAAYSPAGEPFHLIRIS